MTTRLFSGAIDWVMKTRLFQTMGVELPRSGRGTRHLTFLSVDQWMGRFFSLEMPWPAGPRHIGQFSARAVRTNRSAPIRVVGFMGISSGEKRGCGNARPDETLIEQNEEAADEAVRPGSDRLCT